MKSKRNLKLILMSIIIVILACLLIKVEDIFNWAMDNSPWFVIIFLLALAVFITVATIKCLIEKYKEDPQMTKKYIIDSFKYVFISFFIGALFVGIMIFVLLNNV